MKIATTAPASPSNEIKLQQGKEFLKNHTISIYNSCLFSNEYSINKDKIKAQELTDIINSDYDLILCARGGYSSARILPFLDINKLNCPLSGHSDLSALFLYFACNNIKGAISGPMLGVECAKKDTFAWQSLQDCINKKDLVIHNQCSINFKITGKMLPVTLSILAAMLATEYLPSFENVILVIEDINEPYYKIDRYLTQLKQAKILSKIRACFIGDFGNKDYIQDITTFLETEQVLYSYIPNFGHCFNRQSLPVWQEVVCIQKNNELSICF